jgi:inhibitor of cysteine peptidase
VRSLPQRSLPFLLVMALAGCGVFGPREYELGEETVQAEVGEKFTLSVPVDLAMGEHWYVTSPEPDTDVVRFVSADEEWGDDSGPQGASEATKFFDFEAVGEGTTKIRLIQCPHAKCVDSSDGGGVVVPRPAPSGSTVPNPAPTIHTYTVTVRQP